MAHLPINVVALGVYRSVAATMDSTIFAQHSPPRYRTVAILDLASDPPHYRYTAHNLAIVLRALEPRPRVFISGLALPEDVADEAIAVWRDFVHDCWSDDKDAELIDLRREKPGGVDWPTYILSRLDGRFFTDETK